MEIDLGCPDISCGISKLEVINPDGSVSETFGPYNNAITDTLIWVNGGVQAGTPSWNYTDAVVISTGVYFPIKYRGPDTGGIAGNILTAPGLLASYGSGAYVNHPSLTGKLIKFDSGEEFYVSGVVGGNIIMRSGGRISNYMDYIAPGGAQATYLNWSHANIYDVSPQGYTVWDLTDANFRRVDTDSVAAKYGNNSIQSTLLFSTSSSSKPPVTGYYGSLSGGYYRVKTYETSNFGADTIIGKVSMTNHATTLLPFSHVNIGGGTGIMILSGQKVRLSYQIEYDWKGNMSGLLGKSVPTPVVDGWPTSSGFFIPYGRLNSDQDYFFGGYQQFQRVELTPLAGMATFGYTSTTFDIIPITTGAINTPSFSPSYTLAQLQNPTGCMDRHFTCTENTLSVGRITAQSTLNITGSKSWGSCGGFTADINNWNSSHILGFMFGGDRQGFSIRNGHFAFWFHQPQEKLSGYELNLQFTYRGATRKLIN